MSDIDIPELSERAWTLVESNHLVEAFLLFKQLCLLDEHNPESWMMLGSLNAEFSEDIEAIRCLHKALSIDKDYPDAHYSLAKVLVKQGQIENAKNHCQIAVDKDLTYTDAWQLLGLIQEKLGNFIESETYNRKAIELSPSNATCHANLALALWKQGKLQESTQFYRKSLELDSQQSSNWLQLASVLTHLRLLSDAEHCFLQVIAIEPEKIETYAFLGSVLSRQNRHKEALDIFRKAMQLNPEHIGVRLQLGWALYIQKQWDSATITFLDAIKIAPENANAYFGLGATHGAKGMKKEELEHYQHALRLDPANEEIQFHVARLTGGATPHTAPANHIRNLFDAYAESFDEHLVGQLAYKGPELIHAAVTRLSGIENKKMDVLDLGCGTGLCAPLFRPLAHNLSGIDLSEKMIDAARNRNLYDHLVVGDISELLEGVNEAHDLIIAADVFIYVGALNRIIELCSAALKRTGLFAFTVEAAKDETIDFFLEPSGRYSHSKQYLKSLAQLFGLEIVSIQNSILRMDIKNPISSYIVVLRR